MGLETLSLRIDKSSANALAVARWLEQQSKVASVNYPRLDSYAGKRLANRQFPRGVGGILTFDLDSRAECFAFQDALRLVRRATNINDNKTLVLHPSSTIFCEYSDADKTAMGVRDTMLRLSVGIEEPEDIIEDLQKGLGAI